MKKGMLFLILTAIAGLAECAKILVYCPSISKSHVLLCGKYADVLQNAGHDTVLFIPSYIGLLDSYDGAKYAKVWRLDGIGNHFEKLLTSWNEVFEMTSIGFFGRIYYEYYWWIPMCQEMASALPRMQHLIDYEFDLAIVKDVDYCDFAVVRALGIDKIALLSSEPLMDKVSWDIGLSMPSTYVASTEENAMHDRMSFLERVENTWKQWQSVIVHVIVDKWIVDIFRKAVGPQFPKPSQIVRNSSIVLVNTNEMFDMPRPISSKVVYVGLIEGKEQLDEMPENLNKIFNKGSKGAVYISFGTVAPFNLLPSRIQNAVKHTVQSLKDYHFVVKIAAENDTNTLNLFKDVHNVDLVQWVPQVQVLKHKNVRLFVSHGGMNSVLEGMTYGVPMLLMPVFTDQFKNAKNVERRGAGKMIRREQINDDVFLTATTNILTDGNYEINAKRMSKLMNERPFTPEQRLVKYMEYVVEHDTSEILDLEANNLSLIEFYCLDVLATLVATLFVATVLGRKLLSG